MKQALYIFWKDLCRLWPGLCFLLALWSLHVLPLRYDIWSEEPIPPILYWLLFPTEWYPWIVLLMILVHMFLICLLFRKESYVGTSHFRLTRPISMGALLASKCGFVLIFFVGIPIAANVIFLLHFGIEWPYILSLMPAALAGYMTALFIYVALIVLLPNRMFLVLVYFLGIALVFFSWESLEYLADRAFSSGALIILCLVVIGYQYMTRRTARSFAILISGLLAVAGYWTFRETPERTRMVSDVKKPEIETMDLAFQKHIPGGYRMLHDYRDTRGRETIFGALDLSGIPSDCSVLLYRLSCRQEYGDEALFRRREYDPVSLQFAQTLKSTPDAAVYRSLQLVDLLRVEQINFRDYAFEKGILSCTASFKVVKNSSIVNRMSLKQGNFMEVGSERIYVHELSDSSDDIQLTMRHRIVRSVGDEVESIIFDIAGMPPSIPGFRGGFVDAYMGSRTIFPLGFWLSYYQYESIFDRTAAEWIPKGEYWVRRPGGSDYFHGEFKVEDFRLADYTYEAWYNRSNESPQIIKTSSELRDE